MINKVFAQNFVRKIEQTMNLKVNVMDERGVIVASSDKSRIGNFHICAYEIIKKSLPIHITKEPTRELIGVNAPGVNLRLSSNNETIGVIGVSGDPDEVKDIAKMVKLTFETMYEYEYKKSASLKGNNSLWNFSHVLLNENPLNEYSIKKAASRLNFSDNYPRIPIYIRFYSEYLNTVIQHFIDSYSSFSFYKHEDVILPVEQGVFLLKSYTHDNSGFGYTDTAKEYIELLKEEFLNRQSTNEQTLKYKCFIGTVGTEFLHMQRIYHNLLWLASREKKSSNQVDFLQDYIIELLLNNCNNDILDPLFFHYRKLVEEHLDPVFFEETVHGLVVSDMKLEAASQYLHLHKNSVVSRLKKIKEVLDINPITNSRDAILLRCLHFYLQNTNNE